MSTRRPRLTGREVAIELTADCLAALRTGTKASWAVVDAQIERLLSLDPRLRRNAIHTLAVESAQHWAGMAGSRNEAESFLREEFLPSWNGQA